ncbi:MAG: N-formylglutamate amidohydrolase [Pseudomonadota bacterium]
MTYMPCVVEGESRPADWLVTCDHAHNTVPEFVNNGSLGISAKDMERHIAYDPGASGVARALAEQLNGPYIGANFSRLVIDPNRGEDDPTLIMQLYDGTIIPANRYLDDEDRIARLEQCYRPYHSRLSELACYRNDPILISVHSFTPQFRGRAPRPWHVGVLYASDERLSGPLIVGLKAQADLCVGENQPYTGALKGDAMDRHAVQTGRLHALLELRNDLISTPEDQVKWAERLAPLLLAAANDAAR